MKTGIIYVLLATALALVPYLPAVAQDSGTITITMTGAEEFSITVTPTEWNPAGEGIISPNNVYESGITYFTLDVDPTSNCSVKTYIAGEDAVCVDDSTYIWTLSDKKGNRMYVLQFELAEYERGPVVIPKATESSPGEEFFPYPGISSSLAGGETKQFGLKLLTPEPDFTKGGVDYFSVGDATMQTHITISAVAA